MDFWWSGIYRKIDTEELHRASAMISKGECGDCECGKTQGCAECNLCVEILPGSMACACSKRHEGCPCCEMER